MTRSNLGDVTLPSLALVAVNGTGSAAVYRKLLVPRRFVVDCASTGAEALWKAIRDVPDVVIVDAWLPHAGGASLCELLRSEPATKDVPIILLLDEMSASATEAARDSGATAVLARSEVESRLWHQISTLEVGAGSTHSEHRTPNRTDRRPYGP
jgi:CheY-like chemotaxis protein